MFIFLVNITLQNYSIVKALEKNPQTLVYDIQLFEAKIDLYLIALTTLMFILLFFKYLKSNQVFNFGEIIEELNQNIWGKTFKFFGVVLFVVKISTCVFGHPFLIARDNYYSHPEAYSFAYSWILFYFIEMMVTIPKAFYLLKEILYEKLKGQKMNFDWMGPLANMMPSSGDKAEVKADKDQNKLSPVLLIQLAELKAEIQTKIKDQQFLQKAVLVPLY